MTIGRGQIRGALFNFFAVKNSLFCILRMLPSVSKITPANTLLLHKSLKKINKYINHDLSQIVQWLRENRISLNTSKTEIILFCPKTKTITKHLNFTISRQKKTL